ncbi:hypothetical protein ABVK25_011075 [Lepraria finkii]|uniref:Uncharacterized protein n=1 Tax=Lepraria finkii TaxID=1340010 RepID=A0ABR4AX26_9LECA
MPHQSTAFPASLTGKPLYTIYAISTTLLTLPYHLIAYILPSLRPHPEWTYHQSIMNHLMHAFLYHASILELQTPYPSPPGPEGPQNFAAIPRAESTLFRGVLTPNDPHLPATIGGVWYPLPSPLPIHLIPTPHIPLLPRRRLHNRHRPPRRLRLRRPHSHPRLPRLAHPSPFPTASPAQTPPAPSPLPSKTPSPHIATSCTTAPTHPLVSSSPPTAPAAPSPSGCCATSRLHTGRKRIYRSPAGRFCVAPG